MNAPQMNRVTASVEIVGIRLITLAAEARIREPKAVEATVNMRCNAGLPERPLPDGSFIVLVEFNVDVVSPAGADPDFSVGAKFELSYRLPPGTEYSDDEMKQFAATNAVFNAWPYLREITQSTLARMNLPNFVLPLFRANAPMFVGKGELKPVEGD